jgi:hypothetical protein
MKVGATASLLAVDSKNNEKDLLLPEVSSSDDEYTTTTTEEDIANTLIANATSEWESMQEENWKPFGEPSTTTTTTTSYDNSFTQDVEDEYYPLPPFAVGYDAPAATNYHHNSSSSPYYCSYYEEDDEY